MGQAFHKKKLSTNRAHTKGTGISYIEQVPVVPQPMTPAQQAAREEEDRQLESLMKRNAFVRAVIEGTTGLLQDWKAITDVNNTRLRNFAGWSQSSYCELPVDTGVACYYTKAFRAYQRKFGTLDVLQLDKVVSLTMGREARTAQIVEEAAREVRNAAQSCATSDGFCFPKFVQALNRRAGRARGKNGDLSLSLAYVAKQIGILFSAKMKEE